MPRGIFLLACAVLLALANPASAEIKTFRKTVKQIMGNSMSQDDARMAAISRAKQEALQEAGTYLETLTVVQNFRIEKDEILALSSGVLKVVIAKEEPFLQQGVFGILVVAEVKVDTTVLEGRIKKLLGDRRHLEQLKASQQRVAELLAKVKTLEAQNARLSANASQQEMDALKASFRENTQQLTSQGWYLKGWALWNGRGFDLPQRAVEYFSNSIRFDPSFARAYGSRGIAYSDLKQHQRAIQDFDRATDLNPRYDAAYNNRGLTYSDLKQYQRAIQNYDQAINLNPRYDGAYNNRGATYSDLKQYQRAIQDYNRAIELNPRNTSAYKNRGTAYAHLKQNQRAIQDFDRAIELDPRYVDAYADRGTAYLNLKRYPRAIQDYDQAIQLDPRNAIAFLDRGVAYTNLEQYDRAIQDFDRAIELNPRDTNAYNNRGVAYALLKRLDQACRDWTSACELGDRRICDYTKTAC